MTRLSIDYANVSGTKLSEVDLNYLRDRVVLPTPNESVLEQYDWPLPSDPADLPEAFRNFIVSDEGMEWNNTFMPLEDYLYPVSYDGNRQDLADALFANHFNVVLVHNEGDDIMGFMVSSSGLDVSDQICAAYILAGHLPPYRLLLNAINVPDPVMEDALYDAMERHTQHWSSVADRFRAILDAKRAVAPGL